MFNKSATLRRIYLAPAEDGADLGGAAQDVESRVLGALYTDDDTGGADKTVELDGDDLPTDDDVDADADVEIDGDTDNEDDGDQTLASVLGLDEDKLSYDEKGNVVFNAIIDGKAQPVTIQELVKSYQLEGHVNNKSILLENDRKEFEQTRDKAYSELTNRLTQANNILEMVTKQVTMEFQGIDWEGLRMTDPAEWSALRQQFSERIAEIENAKALVGKQTETLTAEQQAEANAKKMQFIQGEINKMIIDNPSWADQAVMAKEVGEIGTFLQSEFGFTPEEIANAMDSRLMRLIRMAYGNFKGQKAVAEKKVKKDVPTFRKPGNNGDRASLQKARQVKAQKHEIRKSGGSVDAVAKAIIDRM